MMNNYLEKYKDSCITSLKHTSYDDSTTDYMCEFDHEILDFDKVVDLYVKENMNISGKLKSNDALLEKDGSYIMIEFKNGKLINNKGDEKKQEVVKLKEKNYDSVNILSFLKNESILELRGKLTYILVYNDEKNPLDYIKKRSHELSNKPYVRFGMNKFKDYLFNKVMVLTKDEFANEFLKIINQN